MKKERARERQAFRNTKIEKLGIELKINKRPWAEMVIGVGELDGVLYNLG
jgi:hypothetical protein